MVHGIDPLYPKDHCHGGIAACCVKKYSAKAAGWEWKTR